MIVPRRAGEITFYEYLGVAPGASSEEIRDAFRAMVRLLHPDQQTDTLLKEIAENQMRKLNRVYSVLSDPERRRRYDEVMEEDYRPAIILSAPSPANRRRLAGRAAWIAAILLSAALLIWFAAEDSPAFQGRIVEPGVPSALLAEARPAQTDAFDQTSRISRLESDLRAASTQRDAAFEELRRLRSTVPGRPGRSSASLAGDANIQIKSITELPWAAKPDSSGSSVGPIVRPAGRQLAGFWFYSKPPQGQRNKNRALYPPEFIELTIAEERGVIGGKYRSRFQIVDRAISPDVTFSFQGCSSGLQISCPWTGPGGAKGDLSLKLTSENSLQIDWSADELGTQQALNSGTAVLTRRIE